MERIIRELVEIYGTSDRKVEVKMEKQDVYTHLDKPHHAPFLPLYLSILGALPNILLEKTVLLCFILL